MIKRIVGHRGLWRFVPHWLELLAGRVVERICRTPVDRCASTTCPLRPLCRCVAAEYHAAVAVEQRVWIVIAACALAVVLYFVLAS